MPILALAHLVVGPGLIPNNLHEFSLKIIWDRLVAEKTAVSWAPKLADLLSPLPLASFLLLTMEKE